MKLSFDEIREIAFGWVESEVENGSLALYKNTARYRSAWLEDKNEFVYGTSLKSTGIRLDFYTDSPVFGMRTLGGGFEIMIDGLFVKAAGVGEDFSIDLGSGEKRVTVYLAAHDHTTIDYVALSDGANFSAAKFTRKILFVGDSITEGWNSGYSFVSYANIVSRAFDAESVVNGCGGGYYLPNIDAKCDFDPDFIIVAFGTNDYDVRRDFADTEKYARGFFDRFIAAYPNKKIFVISPIWRKVEQPRECMGDFRSFCEKLKKIYADYPVEVIDGFALVPHDPAFFAGDNLHPNALGFYVYAENLLRELREKI